jgi:hypothetical protein
MSFSSLTKTSLATALALPLALALGVASAAAADPTPAAIGYALTILTDIGMKPSLDDIIPAMFAELQRESLRTHPELKAPLQAAVAAVTPEFVASEQTVLNDSAKFLANQMTEDELKQTAAFYESPVGKKFIIAQGATAAHVATIAGAWRQKLSVDMVTRVRDELKKKGVEF